MPCFQYDTTGSIAHCRGDARRDETAAEMENTVTQTPIIVALAGMALLAPAPSVAHHAFGAEFDPNRPVRLKGPIRRIEWTNPHVWFHRTLGTGAPRWTT